jgi:hypothetical protein
VVHFIIVTGTDTEECSIRMEWFELYPYPDVPDVYYSVARRVACYCCDNGVLFDGHFD